MRRYDEAISHYQKTLDLFPDAVWIRAQLAWAYASKGIYPQALAEYNKIPDNDKTVAADTQLVADSLGWVYAVSGRRTDALTILRKFNDLSSHIYVDFISLRPFMQVSARRTRPSECSRRVTSSVQRACPISQ
jgi:tetratricopeptide (TPR) repeat protein